MTSSLSKWKHAANFFKTSFVVAPSAEAYADISDAEAEMENGATFL